MSPPSLGGGCGTVRVYVFTDRETDRGVSQATLQVSLSRLSLGL